VHEVPRLWWQHAGNSILAECRRRLPVQRTQHALQLRRRYLQLYRAIHASQRGFVNNRRAYRRLPPAEAVAALQQLEEHLTGSCPGTAAGPAPPFALSAACCTYHCDTTACPAAC